MIRLKPRELCVRLEEENNEVGLGYVNLFLNETEIGYFDSKERIFWVAEEALESLGIKLKHLYKGD